MTTLFSILKTYGEANALLFLGWLIFSVGSPWALKKISPRQWLKTGKIILLAAILLPLVSGFIPKKDLFSPTAQIFSPLNDRSLQESLLIVPNPPRNKVMSKTPSDLFLKGWSLAGFLILLLLGVSFSLGRLVWRLGFLSHALSKLSIVRRSGKFRLVVTDEETVPFSFTTLGKSYVVISQSLCLSEDYRIALRHEIQHLRQGDTRWALGLEVLKALFFWNPAIFYFVAGLTEFQELACDEILIGHRNISALAYGRCLLRAAQSAKRTRHRFVGTASMAASSSGKIIKRRIEMMFNNKKKTSGRIMANLCTITTLGLLAFVAFTAQSAIQDRHISMSEAKALALSTSQGTEIPVNMNELVLAQLNRYLGTPEGRRFIKNSILRMAQYKTMIENRIQSYHAPTELLAVPLVESGYTNSDNKDPHGSGIWSFIPNTARRYHLVVDNEVDERMNAEKETEAAMLYFRDLQNIFHDWRLALKAYNEGETQVQKLINLNGTNDAWELEKIKESKEHYLAEVTAVIIILKNPSLLN